MKRILVPTDFSKHAEYALKVAAQIAKKNDGEIFLVHMLELPTSGNDAISRAHEIPELMFFKNAALAKLDDLMDADYAATIQRQLATKANVANVYTKLYIDELIATYYLKSETYNQKEIDDKLDLKLNASLIANYYLKTETYNQKELDDKLDLKLNASLIANYYLKNRNIQSKKK